MALGEFCWADPQLLPQLVQGFFAYVVTATSYISHATAYVTPYISHATAYVTPYILHATSYVTSYVLHITAYVTSYVTSHTLRGAVNKFSASLPCRNWRAY